MRREGVTLQQWHVFRMAYMNFYFFFTQDYSSVNTIDNYTTYNFITVLAGPCCRDSVRLGSQHQLVQIGTSGAEPVAYRSSDFKSVGLTITGPLTSLTSAHLRLL